ncbi:MAG: hypothetical protein DDT28_00338 [Dehalococcoidia bacterium]|nr:hypothetical protein [Chloroflexota bacterium]
MAKGKIPNKLQIWIDTRKKYHLSHTEIQMAGELGLNPKKFGSLANQRQEKWKLPLGQFIEQLYFKRFGKIKPDRVISIEERANEITHKKEERRVRKHLREASPSNHVAKGDSSESLA